MAFKALYYGRCAVCDGPIAVGDEITWSRRSEKGKRVMHLSCSNKARTAHKPVLPAEQPAEATYNKDEQTTGAQASQPSELTSEVEVKKEMTKAQDDRVLDVLGQALWTRFESKIKHLDGFEAKFEALKSELRKEFEAFKPIKQKLSIKVESPSGTTIYDAGLQHKLFPLLLKLMAARDHRGHRLNIWLAGPTGTGKSTAPEAAAKALGMERIVLLPKLADSSTFFGYFSPGMGSYLRSPARDVWEQGGCLVMDDFDGTDPNIATELQAPLANGLCMFPDGMVPRHPDCVIILTANTWGLGATNDYVGRLRQDAAFLDRFVKLFWDIDENLEIATCPNVDWAKRVQTIRAKAKSKGLKVIISPRASYFGAALLAQGIELKQVEQMVLKGAMTDEQWASLQ